MRERSRHEQDSPWKEVITLFFPQLIELVHPELYQLIDWRRPFQFLDAELQKIAPRSRTGRQTVDKLVQVSLHNNQPQWVLVHIEAQASPEKQFAERMYAYHARLWLHYRREVVSIAILADNNSRWRPSRYEQSLAGCRLLFEFYTVKLLDWDEAQLLAEPSPCALLLLAFRRAAATRKQAELRLQARVELMRLALDRGYNEEEVGNLLRLLEWIMQLPEVLEKRYEELLEEVKRERGTSFLASFERRALREGLQQGWEQGLQQGLAKGLITLLTNLYGEVPESLREQIMQIPSEEILQALYSEAARAGSLEAFEQRLQAIVASHSTGNGLVTSTDA